MDLKYYHVETKRRDGTWQTFTLEPIEGEEAAKKHMASVKDFAVGKGVDPEGHVRLHELTLEDLHEAAIKGLSKEERENIVAEYVRSQPAGEFWKKVRGARDEAAWLAEEERLEAKTA